MMKKRRKLFAAVLAVAAIAVGVGGATSASAATGGLQLGSVGYNAITDVFTFNGDILGPKKCRGKRSVALLGADGGGPLATLKTTTTPKSGAWQLFDGARGVMLLKLKAKKVGSTRCPGTLLVGVITGL